MEGILDELDGEVVGTRATGQRKKVRREPRIVTPRPPDACYDVCL